MRLQWHVRFRSRMNEAVEDAVLSISHSDQTAPKPLLKPARPAVHHPAPTAQHSTHAQSFSKTAGEDGVIDHLEFTNRIRKLIFLAEKEQTERIKYLFPAKGEDAAPTAAVKAAKAVAKAVVGRDGGRRDQGLSLVDA